MTRYFNLMFPGLGDFETHTTNQVFPVDFYSKDDVFCFEAHLPGFEKKDINISLEKSVLTISAKREAPDREYLISEIEHGPQKRSFKLSEDIDQEGITADCKNGVLSIVLPKLKTKRAKVIDIK